MPLLPPGATLAPSPIPADGGRGLRWTQADVTPLGQPAAVGADVAFYGLKAGVLLIEVVDAKSGTVLWSKPASPGGVAAGVAINPSIIGGDVVYLRPAASSIFLTQVVAADPTTGRDVAVSERSFVVTDRPRNCSGQVCFSAGDQDGSTGLQMTLPTGVVTADPARLGLAARTVGPNGLLSIQGTEGERLARQGPGQLLWNRPLADLWGPGYSTNYGWDFRSFDRQDLIVGTVGSIPAGGLKATVFKLGVGSQMLGIRLSTGAKLWSQTGGVDLGCVPPTAVTANSALAAVRCRWGSATTVDFTDDRQHGVLRDASVSLEGFNPATGAITWTVPLADPTGSDYQSWQNGIAVAGQQTLVATGPRGLITVDPVTGRSAPVTSTTQVTCVQSISTAILGADRLANGRRTDFYLTGWSVQSCNTARKPVPLNQSWPDWAGASAAGIRVVATPAGLQGYTQ